MRLSTRGRYGLRVMHFLAKHSGEKPVPLSEISAALDLSESYLEQLIRKLRDKDLVISSRGAYGGYKLSREPKEISAGEILRTLEMHMSPTECAEEDNVCLIEDLCVARVLWKRIQDSINEVVDNYTLEDMLRDEVLISETKEA